ncbi:MAG: response regulator [Bdellovibrionota bacterium]
MCPFSRAERGPLSERIRVPPRHARLPEHILLIEDDESFAQAFAFALEQEGGGEVMVAADSFEAGNLMSQHAFGLVITDWRLPQVNGFSALRKAEQSLSLDPNAPTEWFGSRKVPVIVVTACDTGEVERERHLKGCFQFLGVISKEQAMDGILAQIRMLYGNRPLAATG